MAETSPADRTVLAGSTDRFGYEWATYSAILPEHETQLSRWMGSTGLPSFAGKDVLDVGCGMGRNPHFMLEHGARRLLAIDVDDGSLEAARKNLSRHPNAEVRKLSAYDLDPAAVGTFDRVTCIGVLHHLAEPERALAGMWSVVRPGGDLVLWCYAKEGNELFLPAIRAFQFVGSRLPIRATHAIAKVTSVIAWPVFQVVPFPIEYYRFLRKLSHRNLESIIFDQMLPHIANFWTRSDMERLLRPLGGEVTLEHVQENSWHVRVVKR